MKNIPPLRMTGSNARPPLVFTASTPFCDAATGC